jgi:hypothetical protein
VLARQSPVDGLDVLGSPRVDLLLLGAWQADLLVARRVRVDAGMVEGPVPPRDGDAASLATLESALYAGLL